MNDFKQIISERFQTWAEGDSRPFFDNVADDVVWTVVGTCPGGGTYTSKREFFEQSVAPIQRRMVAPARPEVIDVLGDGDKVVVRWLGHGTAKNGEPYDNTYCWVITVRDGIVVEVWSYLDTLLVENLCSSVPDPTP